MPSWDSLFREEQNRWKEINTYVPLLEERLQRDFCGKNAAGRVNVLDIGCGAGRHLAYFEEKGFQAFGFDASWEALKHAQARAPLSFLNTHNMHSFPWPYPDNFFSGTLAINVIHHGTLQQMATIAGEIARITVRGGWLLATIASPKNHKYGCGTKVDPYTFIPQSGAEAGVPHCFPAFDEVERIFTPHFQLYKLKPISGEVPEADKNKQKDKDHWLILGKKRLGKKR